MSSQEFDSGISRIEVMVVAVVVAVLGGALIPTVQFAREEARQMSCSNNLKQVALGLHNYHDTFRRFPSGWFAAHPNDPSGADSWAWSMMVVPFLQ